MPLIVALTAMAASFLTFDILNRTLDIQGIRLPAVARDALFSAAARRILWMAVAGGLIGAALSLVLLAPIAKLRRRALEAARGNFSETFDLSRQDELGSLGSAFNQMVSYVNRYILDSMSGGVMTVDAAGRVTSFNAAAELILGCEASEVLGRGVDEVFPEGPGNARFHEILRSALAKDETTSSEEVTVRLRDGRVLPIGVTLSHLTDGGARALGVVLAFKDLAEIKRMREGMRRSERLAELGTLAAGVAHEFRNPLGSLQVMAGLLEDGLAEDDPGRAYTRRITRTVERLDRLVRDLLAFAQPDALSLAMGDANAALREAAFYARHEFEGSGVTLVDRLDPTLPEAPMDAEKLFQAFLNLTRNAFQATPRGGTVTISSRRDGALEDRVLLEVRNTGAAIPPEARGKLFSPFFTTKADGTGLGLPITHRIVRAHRGEISVESDEERGTAFAVVLPIVQEAA
ncbi:MAG: PAS domain-containing protein [Candidatus Methylomirabilis sp.]|nr:PAS domain-containing protein [Deltaproteobacteria bacterium]